MRILISNPDTIGDFVLRQPMYAALTAAGHELSVVVRSFVAPIAPLVAPQAEVIPFESNPYAPDFDPDCDDIRRVVAAARAYVPDVFCIAPYQRTPFDEVLAQSLESCTTVGMDGVLYAGYIYAGLSHQSTLTLDRQVRVSVDQHELEKNELLCGELLGAQVRLPDPSIHADPRHLDEALSLVTRLALTLGQFWVASVGQNAATAVRNWGLEQWSRTLAHVVERHGQQILLVGTPDEHETTEKVRSLMGLAGDRAANLCDSPPPLGVSVGLMQLAAGYIGRDTGPMHISAALGKPVIAVFGGGTWPRFTPRPKTGFVATVMMPCAGCNWICHLPEPHCIRRVPLENVVAAFDAMQAGKITGLQIQSLPVEPMLSARSIRESAEACRDLIRRVAAAERQVGGLREDLSRREAVEVEARNAAVLQAAELEVQNAAALQASESQVAERSAELERARAEAAELAVRFAQTCDDLTRAQSGLRGATEQCDRLAAERDQLAAERDRTESELRSERSKAESMSFEIAKIRSEAQNESQRLTDVQNRLLAESAKLKHDLDGSRLTLGEYQRSIQEFEEALREAQKALREHRESLSFRLLVMAGRPVASIGRRLRTLRSRG